MVTWFLSGRWEKDSLDIIQATTLLIGSYFLFASVRRVSCNRSSPLVPSLPTWWRLEEWRSPRMHSAFFLSMLYFSPVHSFCGVHRGSSLYGNGPCEQWSLCQSTPIVHETKTIWRKYLLVHHSIHLWCIWRCVHFEEGTTWALRLRHHKLLSAIELSSILLYHVL